VSEDLRRAPYGDPGLPVEKRVADLLARMTLEEKLAQMTSDQALMSGRAPGAPAAREALRHGIGQLSRPVSTGFYDPVEGARELNALQRVLVEETRLGIPAVAHEEALSGLQVKGATLFPQAIGQASSWDPERVERMARAIRRQMRALGIRQALSPNVDVVRDPRWGRVEECYGEDPCLVAEIGGAFVRGLQGEDPADGCIATLKHFLGYSASEGGRNQEPTHIGPRTLREVFGLPFETLIREDGARSVMNAYSQIDGVPVQRSREILTELLRDEYGFEGLLVSDYGSIEQLVSRHFTAADRSEAAVQAIDAGMDTELPTRRCYGEPLLQAVRDGRIQESRIDALVTRILTWKMRLGLFEAPYVDASATAVAFDTAEDRALARELATASIVLLQNDAVRGRPLLPLPAELRSLAVIGPNADRALGLLGDYSFPVQVGLFGRLIASMDLEALVRRGEGPGDPGAVDALRRRIEAGGGAHVVTVLEGIRSALGEDAHLAYAEGCSVDGDDASGIEAAVAAARACDCAVLVVGDQSGLMGMGTVGEHVDSAGLALPGLQRRLVEAVLDTGTPTVVVLTNGRPFVLDWLAERAPAIVEAWFPGEEGGHAVADVLFGRVSPAGRSCVSFPRHAGIQPYFYNHKPIADTYYDATLEPVFPFGHGLSYTTFAWTQLELSAREVPTDGALDVACRVTNTGERAGEEVVQLYVRDRVASTSRPVRELKGFRRLALAPGESARVRFQLHADRLALYQPGSGWRVEPGEVDVMLGASSADLRLQDRVRFTGPARVCGRERVLRTPSVVDRE
jgi:beta-glucosidase